jgi:ribosome maturation factor RimP
LDLTKIEAVIRPAIEGSGLKLYDIEFSGRILRVMIERADGQVGVNDCAETSRLLSPLLDVEDVIPGGAYELEVSSPGLDRQLRRPEHFQGAVGSRIRVSTREPMSTWNGEDAYYLKRRNLKARLKDFDGVNLKLEAEGRMTTVPVTEVSSASVEFELVKNPKKGKKV